jgi:hypothetical protein
MTSANTITSIIELDVELEDLPKMLAKFVQALK